MIIRDEDYLKHIGILGMKWGHRKGSSSSSSSSDNLKKRQELADELEKVRKRRGTGTKFVDYWLSESKSSKLFSEKHGKSAVAKKGAELSNKLEELRKQRSTGKKIVDFLMTPNYSTRKYSEMTTKNKRKTVVITAALLAGSFGMMKYSGMSG